MDARADRPADVAACGFGCRADPPLNPLRDGASGRIAARIWRPVAGKKMLMYYYDPDHKSPRRWAMIAAAAYGVLLAGSFALVSFDFSPALEKPGDTILVDFTEPPVVEPPKPPVKVATEPRVHDEAAPVEQVAQAAGKDEVTQTPNPKALFKMNRGGADEPDNAGNPRAPEGEEKASGKGPGLNPDGLDQLDKGLQGRGLVGDLPRPAYPGGKSGKVVIRVTVDARGHVTGASYEPVGSTTDASELIEAARAAALKARFTESRATVQGGTITYVFRLN
ncbi:TonB family protein [uncultured Alistipes sp.]|uniref:TonB family protein n=1 Tax=uncultured Alistipes sp. TaxID=538949 RepID=UPI00320AC5FB